jgi:streptomycin 3"-adenylyltransferase
LHNALKEYAEGTDTEYDMNNAENYAVCMVEQIRSEMKRVEKTWN